MNPREVRCENCVFFDGSSEIIAPRGLCRCHSPHPEHGFSLVIPDRDWCGEFAPQEAPAGAFDLADFDAWLKQECPEAVADLQIDDDGTKITGTIVGGVNAARRVALFMDKLAQTGLEVDVDFSRWTTAP